MVKKLSIDRSLLSILLLAALTIVLMIVISLIDRELIGDDYDNIIPKNNVTIVVSMSECSGCATTKIIVQELKNEGFAISLVEGRDQLAKYRVDSVPTIIVFNEGREIRRHVGALSREEIIAFITR
jgi:thioredoxin-related protein